MDILTHGTGDVMLYVVGGADENEIMLYNVVLALRDSLNILLKSVHPCSHGETHASAHIGSETRLINAR